MEVTAALRVEEGLDEDLAIQVALLHDLLEDTKINYRQIADEFGLPVADGVSTLTKDAAIPKQARMKDSLECIIKQPRKCGWSRWPTG